MTTRNTSPTIRAGGLQPPRTGDDDGRGLVPGTRIGGGIDAPLVVNFSRGRSTLPGGILNGVEGSQRFLHVLSRRPRVRTVTGKLHEIRFLKNVPKRTDR